MFARGFKSWCENVAIQQRRELKLKPSDPLDPKTLAEHLGINVWSAEDVPGLEKEYLKVLLEDDPDSWSAVTLCVGTENLIILNSSHRGGRPASDLMHEISHIILDHKANRAFITGDGLLMLSTFDKKQEEEAGWLTGCLLLPREALMQIALQKTDLRSAAEEFSVSVSMLQYRMNVTGVKNQINRRKKKTTTARK